MLSADKLPRETKSPLYELPIDLYKLWHKINKNNSYMKKESFFDHLHNGNKHTLRIHFSNHRNQASSEQLHHSEQLDNEKTSP